ncbi:MAG: hypothetical protein RID91_20875 [Azospirillaceae bacterium]
MHSLRLPAPETAVADEAATALRRVAHLAELIRDYQDLQTVCAQGRESEIGALCVESAELLERASLGLACPASATVLRRRAEALRGRPLREVAPEAVAQDETELLSVCGDLATWHGKGRQVYHSALFATVERRFDTLVATIDARREAVEDHLRATVHPRLELAPPPGFKVGDLMLCGGEANRYPKHFAYFLPEDEGVKHAPVKKTIVFRNVYLEMYRCLSQPFGLQVLDIEGAVADPSPEAVQDHLALWFRGHDTGHGVTLPETDFKALGRQGRWASMMMQETLADVFGFLLIAQGPWTETVELDCRVAATTFLTEMLRYLRRGETYFPDSGAAFLELAYLVDHGHVIIDWQAGTIATSVERLVAGCRDLARTLATTALANDEPSTRDFLATYGLAGRAEFARAFRQRFGLTTGVLDYIQPLPGPPADAAGPAVQADREGGV